MDSNFNHEDDSAKQERLATAIIRQDFPSFIHKVFNTINPGGEYIDNWHINLIAEYLEAVRNNKIKRLIINMPPRALKSACVTVAWPAWILAHEPSARIMTASYSNMLSIKHSLDTRFVMSSKWYRKIFTATKLNKKQNQKHKFMTTKYGFRFSTSVGGSATGEGGDYLIIDDPSNPIFMNSAKYREKVINWFEQTFSTRLNNREKGAIIIVMQRLHENDLTGYLLNKPSSEWVTLKIPSYVNTPTSYNFGSFSYQFLPGKSLNDKRDSMDVINKLINEIGVNNFAAQYLQDPIKNSSSLIELSKLHFYDNIDNKEYVVIQSWDTAIKNGELNDYSVCTVWAITNEKAYLIDCINMKLEYPELKKMALELNQKYKPFKILIEDKASGQSLIQELKKESLNNIISIRPTKDKLTRLLTSTDYLYNGKILLPNSMALKNLLLEQLLHFPNCKHDDIIDSISQFINYYKDFNWRNNKAIIRQL